LSKNLYRLILFLLLVFYILNCNRRVNLIPNHLYQKENYKENLFSRNEKINLILKIEAEEDFELEDVNFYLANGFPEEYSEDAYELGYLFHIPFIYKVKHIASIDSIYTYTEKIEIKNGNVYEFVLEPNTYYALLERKGGQEFSFLDFKRITVYFGYIKKGSLYNKVKEDVHCQEIQDSSSHKAYEISCPVISIEENKITNIQIKIGKKKWNSFFSIFLKFIPGILFLGPFNNLPQPYFHRDIRIEITK